MTKSDIYSISLKIFGIYFLVRFIISAKDFVFLFVGNFIFSNASSSEVWMFSGIIFSTIIEFLVGYFLIFKTENIIAKISKNKSDNVNISSNRVDFLEVGLAIIAVLLVAYSMADLLSYFVESTYYHDHRESVYFEGSNLRLTYYSVFKFFAGGFLLFNARNFSKLIVKRGDADDKKDNEN